MSKVYGIFFLIILVVFGGLVPGRCNDSDILVITQEEIKGYNVRTIYELLNRLPGLKAGSTSLTIRGSSKVKAFMDGKSLNDPSSSYGGIRWDAVDLKRVEQIRIFKGKGGVEFGDDASGGVVDIVMQSLAPGSDQPLFKGTLETFVGSHDTWSVKGGLRTQKGKWGVDVSFGVKDTQGFRINSDKLKKRVAVKTSWTLSEKTKINGSISYFDTQKGNSGLPGRRTLNSRSHNDITKGLIQVAHGKLKAKTYISQGARRTKDPDKNLNTFLDVLEIGQTVSLPLSFEWSGRFKIGAGYEYAKGKASGFDTHTEQKAYGFVSKRLSLKPLPLNLNLGVRGIHYSTYEDTLNPEVSLNYSNEAFSCLVSAARTSNTPSFKKKYQETSTLRPNPDLDLEKATNFGLTLAWEFDRFSVALSPFYNFIDNRISYVRDSDGTGQYKNFGKVTYKGIDVSLSVTPLEWLMVQSGYTYLLAKNDETERWLSVKPRHRWVTSFTLTPVDNFTLGMTVKAVSSLYTNSRNTEKAPGYATLDMRCEYALGQIRLFGEANNLLDKTYLLGDGYDAAPFNWIVGAAYSF